MVRKSGGGLRVSFSFSFPERRNRKEKTSAHLAGTAVFLFHRVFLSRACSAFARFTSNLWTAKLNPHEGIPRRKAGGVAACPLSWLPPRFRASSPSPVVFRAENGHAVSQRQRERIAPRKSVEKRRGMGQAFPVSSTKSRATGRTRKTAVFLLLGYQSLPRSLESPLRVLLATGGRHRRGKEKRPTIKDKLEEQQGGRRRTAERGRGEKG